MADDTTSRQKDTDVTADDNNKHEKDDEHNNKEATGKDTIAEQADSKDGDESANKSKGEETTKEQHGSVGEEGKSSVWAEAWDDQSQAYYWWNTVTYETTWDDPNGSGGAAGQSSTNELDSVLDTIDAEVRSKLDGNQQDPSTTAFVNYQYNPSSSLDNNHLGATDPYRFQAFFNTKTGRFQSAGDVAQRNPENYSIEARGRRQMEHYFDVDAYQAERNQRTETGRKRSLTKKEIERFKRAKKEKKMNRMREWLRD